MEGRTRAFESGKNVLMNHAVNKGNVDFISASFIMYIAGKWFLKVGREHSDIIDYISCSLYNDRCRMFFIDRTMMPRHVVIKA